VRKGEEEVRRGEEKRKQDITRRGEDRTGQDMRRRRGKERRR